MTKDCLETMHVIGNMDLWLISRFVLFLLAEIWCVFHGLELAKMIGGTSFEVESNSYVAVAMTRDT